MKNEKRRADTHSDERQKIDRELDAFFADLATPQQPAPVHLQQRIMQSIGGPQRKQSEEPIALFEWLRVSLWRGALATLLPLLIGFSIGSYAPGDEFTYEAETLLFAENLEEYDDDEI